LIYRGSKWSQGGSVNQWSDSHHFDKEHGPDSDQEISFKEKRGIRIRICINVKRIRNTVWNQIQIQEKERIKGSDVDPDPDWTRIEWGPWISIQIQEGKNNPQK
jgi:hypothetical protein